MNTDLHSHYPKAKRKMRKAFIELLADHTLAEIKVSDITEKSDYTRQAFYLHYNSKEAILGEIVKDLADGLIDLMIEAGAKGIDQVVDWLTEPYHPYFEKYFSYMRSNSEVILLLISRHADFIQQFNQHLESYQNMSLERWIQVNGENNVHMTQWYRTAMRTLIDGMFHWVQNGMEPDEVVMAKFHTHVWISSTLLTKNAAPGSISNKVRGKMAEKGLDTSVFNPISQHPG